MVIPGLALSNVSEGSVALCVDGLLHGHMSIADRACSAGHASASRLTTKRHSVNVTTLDRWWASLVAPTRLSTGCVGPGTAAVVLEISDEQRAASE